MTITHALVSIDRNATILDSGHWVSLLAVGKDALWGTPLKLVMPPCVLYVGDRALTCTPSFLLTSFSEPVFP